MADAGADGFVLVTRGPPRRGAPPPRRGGRGPPTSSPPPPPLCARGRASRGQAAALRVGEDGDAPEDWERAARALHGRLGASEFASGVLALLLPHGPYVKIECYGLGHFADSPLAGVQLALLLLLRDRLGAAAEVHDPALTQAETHALERLGVAASARSDNGARAATSTTSSTLYFMPHCPKAVYHNVLWANWGDGLDRVVMVGNSLAGYEARAVTTAARTRGRLVHAALAYAAETPLPLPPPHGEDPLRLREAFSDATVHVFTVPPGGLDAAARDAGPETDEESILS